LPTFCLSAVVTSVESADSERSASPAVRAIASREATTLLATRSAAVAVVLPLV
jgi:hypothetical protein